ncbi:hypothetical protein CDAR_305541 [Caerostris darwini]|uniref:Uncharacterized protein n=1 Tax=Caerostris darwini TaxID=1538125 RepID=A0AAV4MC39_9ARAC|nr:hypothetical protein CDAR_305541 [Caerostris darwini]
MDLDEICFFIPEIDSYNVQTFLSESQEINLIKPHSYAVDAVSKYRKFISWWISVRKTPRIMVSDFRLLFHSVKICKLPFETFLTDIESLGSVITTFIENYDILKKELISFSEEVEDFVKCTVHFNPETSDEFFEMYNYIVIYGCDVVQYFVDCKESFDEYINITYNYPEFSILLLVFGGVSFEIKMIFTKWLPCIRR